MLQQSQPLAIGSLASTAGSGSQVILSREFFHTSKCRLGSCTCTRACMYRLEPYLHMHVFTLTDAIAPRSSSSKGGAMPVLEGDTSRLQGAVSKGEGRATLRLKKDGKAVVEEVVSGRTLSHF